MNTMDTPTSNLPIHPCKAGIEEKRWKEWTYSEAKVDAAAPGEKHGVSGSASMLSSFWRIHFDAPERVAILSFQVFSLSADSASMS